MTKLRIAVVFGFTLLLGGTSASAQDLTGAGSTFIAPIMSKWVDEYKTQTGITINYQAVGSGAGINSLIDHTVDFAGSDAPMNADERARAKAPVLHLPAVIGAVCVSYNVDGIPTGLGLSGDIIADIFLGKINYWDDPRIVSRNANRKLPHERIFTVHRSDGSGTTAIFTSYLSRVSSEWKSQVGDGKSVKWPGDGLGGKGNQGVAGVLKEHPNSIGYVELAYAVQNNIPYAAIEDSHHKYVYPTVGTASQAAKVSPLADDMTGMITNSAAGYPISGFTWIITYTESAKAKKIRDFLKWILTTGQKDTRDLYYASIPDNLKKRELNAIATMH